MERCYISPGWFNLTSSSKRSSVLGCQLVGPHPAICCCLLTVALASGRLCLARDVYLVSNCISYLQEALAFCCEDTVSSRVRRLNLNWHSIPSFLSLEWAGSIWITYSLWYKQAVGVLERWLFAVSCGEGVAKSLSEIHGNDCQGTTGFQTRVKVHESRSEKASWRLHSQNHLLF